MRHHRGIGTRELHIGSRQQPIEDGQAYKRPNSTTRIAETKGRKELALCLTKFPMQTPYATELVLERLESVAIQIAALEKRMKEVFQSNKEIEYLESLTGVGSILAAVIFSEVGDVARFLSASHFASYAGTVPSVHASEGKIVSDNCGPM